MSRKKYDNEAIVALYVSGLSFNQLAEKTSKSLSTVYDIVRKAGKNRPREQGVCHHDYFNNIDSSEKAYWLGFFTGDGCVAYSRKKGRVKNELCLSLSDKDKEHVALFRQCLGITNPLRFHDAISPYAGKTAVCSVRVSSPQLCQDLIAKGVTPRKSLVMDVPRGVPEMFDVDLWRGLVDANGSVGFTSRPQLVVDLVGTEAIVSGFLSWSQKICPNSVHIRPKGNVWNVRLSSRTAEKVLEAFYYAGAICLPRKKAKYEAYLEAKTNRMGTGDG